MRLGKVPNPVAFQDIREWAKEMYRYFGTQVRFDEENDPLPVLLPHRTSARDERATTDGIMLHDPLYETSVVSENNEWVPVVGQQSVQLNYDTAATTNGAAVGTGGAKIPFDTEAENGVPWCTFNAGTNDFTLIQGKYFIEGYVTLTKLSGGAKNITGYLAQSSDLTTPVGTVSMGTLRFASSAPNNTTKIVPFIGTVAVPAGGQTLAMVVLTNDTNVTFGVAHGITGYENIYSRLSIKLAGLNGA